MSEVEMSELIARAVHGKATLEDREALRRWRERSPENDRHYREVVRLLMESEEAVWDDAMEEPPPSVETILARTASTTPAIAAVRWSRRPDRPGRIRVALAGGGILGAAAIAAVIALFMRQEAPPPVLVAASFGPQEIVTGVAETTIVRLGDGTVIRLAPESRLLIPGPLGSEGARQVWLTGRAFFAVTRDESGRPFVIRSHAGDATVLGTRFDLSVDDDDLRALVIEGLVRLNAPGEASNEVEVGASQIGMVSPLQRPSRQDVDDGTIDLELRWLGNYLVFEATPLRQVASELERRYEVPVRILDPSLEAETVRGVFLNESLDDVVNVICRALSAHCIARESGVTLGL